MLPRFGHQAHDRLECRGLARAVAAQQAHDFADIDAEREVPEHPDVPVIGEDAVYTEHHTPR